MDDLIQDVKRLQEVLAWMKSGQVDMAREALEGTIIDLQADLQYFMECHTTTSKDRLLRNV